MRKTPAIAMMVVIALLLGSAAPLLLQAQTGGGPSRLGPASQDDLPLRTTKAFAPFVRALIMRRMNTAQQIFKIRRSVLTMLDYNETQHILGRLQKPDNLFLNLVGGRSLGQNIGILLFTIANEEGPVYFKVYYYGVNDVIYIDRMDIGEDWDELETLATTIQPLQTPITVPLGVIEEGAGQ